MTDLETQLGDLNTRSVSHDSDLVDDVEPEKEPKKRSALEPVNANIIDPSKQNKKSKKCKKKPQKKYSAEEIEDSSSPFFPKDVKLSSKDIKIQNLNDFQWSPVKRASKRGPKLKKRHQKQFSKISFPKKTLPKISLKPSPFKFQPKLILKPHQKPKPSAKNTESKDPAAYFSLKKPSHTSSKTRSSGLKNFTEMIEIPVQRPQRQAKKRAFLSYEEGKGETTSEYVKMDGLGSDYVLVKPAKYASEMEQPIEVNISLEWLMLMTVHAHLYSHEIIGYLAGDFLVVEKDGRKRELLYIHNWLPLKPLELSGEEKERIDRTRNVEMDAESAQNAMKIAEDRGEKILAWYHSHPIFEVYPSKVDIRNHTFYQESFKKDNHPFIAFIIGPYSKKVSKSSCKSLLSSFHILNGHPYSLPPTIIPTSHLSHSFLSNLSSLISTSFSSSAQLSLTSPW
jgi:proteasome lid subunit RPN8/RPN11